MSLPMDRNQPKKGALKKRGRNKPKTPEKPKVHEKPQMSLRRRKSILNNKNKVKFMPFQVLRARQKLKKSTNKASKLRMKAISRDMRRKRRNSSNSNNNGLYGSSVFNNSEPTHNSFIKKIKSSYKLKTQKPKKKVKAKSLYNRHNINYLEGIPQKKKKSKSKLGK